jgi:hypothetical protein
MQLDEISNKLFYHASKNMENLAATPVYHFLKARNDTTKQELFSKELAKQKVFLIGVFVVVSLILDASVQKRMLLFPLIHRLTAQMLCTLVKE